MEKIFYGWFFVRCMALSDRDYRRIVKEIESVRGVDVVGFLEERSPWFRFAEPAVARASAALEEAESFHVLFGFRPLPLYGVPYISRDLVFAARIGEDHGKIAEAFAARGFEPAPSSGRILRFIDLQSNRVVEVLPRPGPLDWDEELVERSFEGRGLRVLSAEDYAVALLSEKVDTMRLELAAKVFYANWDKLDRGYLVKRASDNSVKKTIDDLLSGLESASRR